MTHVSLVKSGHIPLKEEGPWSLMFEQQQAEKQKKKNPKNLCCKIICCYNTCTSLHLMQVLRVFAFTVYATGKNAAFSTTEHRVQ